MDFGGMYEKEPVLTKVDEAGNEMVFYTVRRKSLLEYAAQHPHDKSAGDTAKHLKQDREDEVHEVLPSVAVGPAGERHEGWAPVFIIQDDDVAELRKLVEGGENPNRLKTSYALYRNLAKSAFYPVERLKRVEQRLLLLVESYKALLVCHLVLLLVTVAVLVAMARA